MGEYVKSTMVPVLQILSLTQVNAENSIENLFLTCQIWFLLISQLIK